MIQLVAGSLDSVGALLHWSDNRMLRCRACSAASSGMEKTAEMSPQSDGSMP